MGVLLAHCLARSHQRSTARVTLRLQGGIGIHPSSDFTPEPFQLPIPLPLAPFPSVRHQPHQESADLSLRKEFPRSSASFATSRCLPTERGLFNPPQKYLLLVHHSVLKSKPSGALVEVSAAHSERSSV